MIKSAHISGFRSCLDVNIDDLGKFVALVGKNGAGKTNTLRGIEWAARCAVSTDQGLSPQRNLTSKRAVTLVVELAEGTYEYTVTSVAVRLIAGAYKAEPEFREIVKLLRSEGGWTILVDRVNEQVMILNRGDPVRTGASTPCLPVLASILPNDDSVLVQILPLTTFLGGVRYYPLHGTDTSSISEPQLIQTSTYDKWTELNTRPVVLNDSVVMRLFDMYTRNRPVFDELQSLLGTDGLGLVSNIAFTEVPLVTPPNDKEKYYFIRFTPVSGVLTTPGQFEFSDLSAGTRRVLRILVSLFYDQSSVMLIEQPEDSIHAGLMKKLISVLHSNSDPCQIILASHSSAVLNKLRPDEIRLVSMDNVGTRVKKLDPTEIKAALDYIQSTGSLSGFLGILEGE